MTPRVANIANIRRADESPGHQDGPLWYADPTGETAIRNMAGVCTISFESSDVVIYVDSEVMKSLLHTNFHCRRTRKGHIRADIKRAA